MADEVRDAIDSSAQGPRQVTADGMSINQHSLKDLIEADRYLESRATARASGLGIKRLKISPGGTI